VKLVTLINRLWPSICISLLCCPYLLHAQTTTITTEYLMTIYAPLDPVQTMDSALYIYYVRPGGWVKGPQDQRHPRGSLASRHAFRRFLHSPPVCILIWILSRCSAFVREPRQAS